MIDLVALKEMNKTTVEGTKFANHLDPKQVEKSIPAQVEVHSLDSSPQLESLKTKCSETPFLNTKMEILGVETAIEYYKVTENITLIVFGGKGLPDLVGYNPTTGKLIFVECKGTSNDVKRFRDFDLITEKRTENSPEWLDKNSGNLLQSLEKKLDINPANEELQKIKHALEDIMNDGGFAVNPNSYESALSITCKQGAVDIYGESNQNSMKQWLQETGSKRIDIHEIHPSIINEIAQK